ncbi:DNA glycosylase AlkZ-like family protein [Gordonia phthalatica]|uniref:ATPase AAA n=1 Tax=Gordonia phthalatica TaxID=1136941 RepID=A0A0N9NCV5_9ACTN|nr:crosslink repair DNA glycosylase YcaQ family protein [Gordonia phthalatica]ALG86315.1 ATPase AAA [Gordonia phthalatica]
MAIVDTADLIRSGESLAVEFKRDITDKELAKAVACLANGKGGTLLIGVDDDGTLVGAKPRHPGETDPNRVAAYIQAATEPALAVAVRIDMVDGFSIIRIDVPVADPGPIGTKLGVFTRRTLDPTGRPACVPMTPHEIVSMGMLSRGQDFAGSIALGATELDLDPNEFDRFRRFAAIAGDSIANLTDNDILRALGLVPLTAPISLGAILLFGTGEAISRWIPNAECLFQDLRVGIDTANVRIVEPLLKAAEHIQALIDERNTITELTVGIHRVEIPLIPSVTRREAIANALVHRDYASLGPITVQITDSEFVVSSPGSFPPGVTATNILDQSRPRSPILAAALKRAGVVERRGKGVNDMFEQQLRAGRSAPDYARSTDAGVIVSVPLGNADLDLVRFLLTWEDDQQHPLNLDELRIVHEVKSSGSATSTEVTEALNAPSVATKTNLGRLVEKGILESRGTGRSRKYHLTARFYDLAQDRNAYVRVKGADPLQQERMILDYVSAYSSISRAQAAELCQITPPQASRILKQLATDGRLALRGERRGAHYVLPGTPQ